MFEKSEEHKKKNGIRTGMFGKIFVLAAICMIVPLLASTIATVKLATNQMQGVAKDTLMAIADKEVVSIEDYLDSQKTLTKSVAENPTVLGACLSFNETKAFNPS